MHGDDHIKQDREHVGAVSLAPSELLWTQGIHVVAEHREDRVCKSTATELTHRGGHTYSPVRIECVAGEVEKLCFEYFLISQTNGLPTRLGEASGRSRLTQYDGEKISMAPAHDSSGTGGGKKIIPKEKC